MPLSHKEMRCCQKLHPDSMFKFWEGQVGGGEALVIIMQPKLALKAWNSWQSSCLDLNSLEKSEERLFNYCCCLQRTRFLLSALWYSSQAHVTLASGNLTPSSGPHRHPHAQQAVLQTRIHRHINKNKLRLNNNKNSQQPWILSQRKFHRAGGSVEVQPWRRSERTSRRQAFLILCPLPSDSCFTHSETTFSDHLVSLNPFTLTASPLHVMQVRA